MMLSRRCKPLGGLSVKGPLGVCKRPATGLLLRASSSHLRPGNNGLQHDAQSTLGSIHKRKRRRDVSASNNGGSGVRGTSWKREIRPYMQLSKARLTGLVVASSAAGYLMAGIPSCMGSLACAAVGTGLASASANTWNQVYETWNDGQMHRTRARPLPSGRLSPTQASIFGVLAGGTGVGVLYFGCNPMTAILGAANIALYSAVYTPLKQLSPINTHIGAVVGAIPPLMGYSAAGGDIMTAEAMSMASLLFLWQMPHFYALAWRHREDYSRGGYKMISLNDANGLETAQGILGYSVAMSLLPVVVSALGVTSPMFAVWSCPANLYVTYKAWKFYSERSDKNARSVFLASLWYLPLLMTLMVIHSSQWETESVVDEKAAVLNRIQHRINETRNLLRSYCVHEAIKSSKIEEGKEVAGTNESNEEETKLIKSHVRKQCPITRIDDSSRRVEQRIEKHEASSKHIPETQ
eukprot:gb/GECG01008978.1/.p1 GENE.gb/GECG01008978.1/~~gb/GECG01008978.1/.p1  ORF type:complete len:466 (+),score=32.38 gb/GECG01008978.1/:1-1398(+)